MKILVQHSMKKGLAIRLEISGKVGRIGVTGYTSTIFLGLDKLDYQLVERTLTLNRSDGFGKAVPYATRRQVILAALDSVVRAGGDA